MRPLTPLLTPPYHLTEAPPRGSRLCLCTLCLRPAQGQIHSPGSPVPSLLTVGATERLKITVEVKSEEGASPGWWPCVKGDEKGSWLIHVPREGASVPPSNTCSLVSKQCQGEGLRVCALSVCVHARVCM